MAEIEALRLTDRVKNGLIRMIAEDGLQPGDKLPPSDRLCEQFSVSRTVVREAIASLKAEGRLRSLRGSGVYVSEPPKPTGGNSMFMEAPQDIGDVLDFMEFRMSVEIEAAGLAAERPRSCFRRCLGTDQPSFSAPTRPDFGTRTLSKKTSHCSGKPSRPMIGRISMPG